MSGEGLVNTPQVGVVLALDIGARRVGVAKSDPERRFAYPAPLIERRSRDQLLAAIRARLTEEEATTLVVGWPLQLSGEEGIQTFRVRRLLSVLAPTVHCPIYLQDERLSTVEAERSLIAGGVRREARRTQVDSMAASLILQTWLARWAGGHLIEEDLFSSLPRAPR